MPRLRKVAVNDRPARGSVGVWIDHREAVLVFVAGEGKELVRIFSHVERSAPAPSASQRVPADDSHERRFAGQLARFYERVAGLIAGTVTVLIFGPGEAKGELRRHLAKSGPVGRVVLVEAAERMTDGQRVRKVREHFGLSRPLVGTRAVAAPHEQHH